jgi:shikimate dehydrogenase
VIGGRTALYGVMGHPVAHSRSPAMQNAAFTAAGLDACYLALPVEPSGLEAAVRGAHALGFRGLNVTVPHKQAALPLCRALDATARQVGAVNTLRRMPSGWEGFNTDAPAARALLEAAGVRPGAVALLVGAGGSARAGAWAALQLGCRLLVAARRPEAGEALARQASAALPQAGPGVRAVAWGDLPAAAADAGVLLNCTPVGLHPGDAPLPIAFRAGQVALDFVYGDTTFTGEARAAGARVVTGEEILVRQGALAFTLWTGRPAPEALMAAAVARAPTGSPP